MKTPLAIRILVLAVALVLVVPATFAQKRPGNQAIPVTSRLLAPAPHLEGGIILSDAGNGGSDTYIDRQDAVSIFQGGGDWQLSTLTSEVRRMYLDLDATNPNPLFPFDQQYVQAWFVTHCGTVRNLQGVGSTTTCSNTFRFEFPNPDGAFYRIGFNTVVRPGTGELLFTCEAVDSSNACVEWSLAPADNEGTGDQGDGLSTGQLQEVKEVPTGKGKQTTLQEISLGWFKMNFNGRITRP